MRIKAYAGTDVGRKREVNEDGFLVDEELGLYLVCDGMGGHAAGEVAANETARVVAENLRVSRIDIKRELGNPGGHFRVVQIVTDAVRVACQQVYGMAVSQPECAGMGSTLTLMLVIGDKAVLAHVGDSRLYLLRSNQLHQLTVDHTLANELVQTGRVAAGDDVLRQYENVLTRCVGGQEFVDVETLLFDILPGDRFLLCTDGLTRYVLDNTEMVQELSSRELATLPWHLIDLANRRGGKDNITCIVLEASGEIKPVSQNVEQQLTAMAKSQLFEGLSVARLMHVVNSADLKLFEQGQDVVCVGDDSSVYVVVDGECNLIQRDGSVVELILGDTFGELALARDGRSAIAVKACGPCSLLRIQRSDFRRLTRRFPKMGRRLLENLALVLAAEIDSLTPTGFEPASLVFDD